jgi:hypothetical protein
MIVIVMARCISQRDYHDLGGTIIICLVMEGDLLQHPLLKLALDRKEHISPN